MGNVCTRDADSDFEVQPQFQKEPQQTPIEDPYHIQNSNYPVDNYAEPYAAPAPEVEKNQPSNPVYISEPVYQPEEVKPVVEEKPIYEEPVYVAPEPEQKPESIQQAKPQPVVEPVPVEEQKPVRYIAQPEHVPFQGEYVPLSNSNKDMYKLDPTPEADAGFKARPVRDPRKLTTDQDLLTAPQGELHHVPTGNYYYGGLRDNKPHGWGNCVTRNGSWTQGFFKNGKEVSHVRQATYDGKVYEGDFSNGYAQGEGKLYRRNGNVIYSKTWNKGLPQGKFIEKDSKGNFIFEGAQTQKGIDGPCKLYKKDFTVTGTFKDGTATEPLTKTYTSGVVYQGKLDANLLEHGYGKSDLGGGRKYEGIYYHGKPHGTGFLINEDGRLVKQKYNHGVYNRPPRP